jgi:hypothetical protein
VAWSFDPTSGTATLLAALPGDPPQGNDPRALVTVVAGIPVVATNAAAPSVQVGCQGGWRTLPSPGVATSLVASGTSLFAIASGILQRLDAPTC